MILWSQNNRNEDTMGKENGKKNALLHVLDVLYILVWTPHLKDGNFSISSDYSSRSRGREKKIREPTIAD